MSKNIFCKTYFITFYLDSPVVGYGCVDAELPESEISVPALFVSPVVSSVSELAAVLSQCATGLILPLVRPKTYYSVSYTVWRRFCVTSEKHG